MALGFRGLGFGVVSRGCEVEEGLLTEVSTGRLAAWRSVSLSHRETQSFCLEALCPGSM